MSALAGVSLLSAPVVQVIADEVEASAQAGGGSSDGGSSSDDGGSSSSEAPSGGDSSSSGSGDTSSSAGDNGGGGSSSGEDSGSGSGSENSTESGSSGSTDSASNSSTGSDTGSTDASTAETGATSAGTSSMAPTGEEEAAEAATTGVTANEEEEEKDYGDPEGLAEALEHTGTNEELIAQQNIQDIITIERDFRFVTVDKEYSFARTNLDILEERDEDAKVVGTIAKLGVLFILEEEENDWYYVESGDVRGFVRGEDLLMGDGAAEEAERLKNKASALTALLGGAIEEESVTIYAEAKVPYYENEAYAYRKITTRETLVDKNFAVTAVDVDILEETSADAEAVGQLREGGLVYVLLNLDNGWSFVESGDVRGFVEQENLILGDEAVSLVEEKGEDNYVTASELVKPEENEATYFTLTSVKEGVAYNEIREKIVEKAAECIGNPYVWGGTSLTNGADCSGFVQSLYALFGYSIPRVADAQSRYGTQIPVSEAQPGDLIFFARNGYVYHVAMYAGNGKTIEAYSTSAGIISKSLDNRNAVWATRIIED